MNSKIELIVLGTSGSTANGIIDLYSDEPIELSISCADISDITQRKTPFTKSFIVPGTSNNNVLFNYIFEIGEQSAFNPAKKTPCQLTVDSIPVVTGNLQLTGIQNDDQKNISYQVTIFGDTEDLVDAVGANLISDLNYTDLNHVWNLTNIMNSWTGTSQPYFYPLIDYGYDLNLYDMQHTGVGIQQLYPAIQAKQVWDRIFKSAGYTYSSTFLNSTYFKNLYLPFNGNTDGQLTPSYINNFKFNAVTTGTTTISYPLTEPQGFFGFKEVYDLTNYNINVNFNSTSINNGFDNGNNYNTSTFKYTVPSNSIQQFNVKLIYNFTHSGSTTINNTNGVVYTVFQRSGWPGYQFAFPGQKLPNPLPLNQTLELDFTSPILNGNIGTPYEPAQSGETFWVTFSTAGKVNFQDNSANYYLRMNILSGGTISGVTNYTSFYNTPPNSLVPNTLLPIQSMVPQNVKQIDYLNSIITMHNLYIVSDPNNIKNLLIEPRDTFYSTGATKNWSSKLDLTTPIQTSLLSEQQSKRIIFSYTPDNDYFNSDYTNNTKHIFGDEYVTINNDFVKDDQNINVIFSPTPSSPVFDSIPQFLPTSSGNTGVFVNDFIIPKIGKISSNNQFGSTNFNIRILQKNPSNTLSLASNEYWNVTGYTSVGNLTSQTFTTYPYLGMLDHPFSSTTDIAFGQVAYEYYSLPSITSNNLVNAYYTNYLNQIIDPNGKIITANFYLTPADIQNFKFSDNIFVDGLGSDGMGEYFIVNSITYTPTANQTSVVELIKVPNEQVSITNNSIATKGNKILQSVTLGGASTLSTQVIGVGPNVSIGQASNGTVAMGSNLIVNGSSKSTLMMGSNSSVGAGSSNLIALGNNNSIGAALNNGSVIGNNITVGATNNNIYNFGDYNVYNDSVTNTAVFGNNNQVTSAATNSFIIGSNITATTSATTYVNNLVVSTGSSVNYIPINTILTGATLWSSTGSTSGTFQNNGQGNIASGAFSLSFGQGSIASGQGSFAGGDSTASGPYSTALGDSCVASGYGSVAMGETSSATTGIAIGYKNLTTGTWGITMGQGNKATGYYTIAMGQGSEATGDYSVAIGTGVSGHSGSTIVIGTNSVATKYSSISIGNTNQVFGQSAIAIQNDNTAGGDYSFASGYGVSATRYGEFKRSTDPITFNSYGSVQAFSYTTNATPTEAFLDNGVANQRFTILDGTGVRVAITAVAIVASNFPYTAVTATKEWSGTVLVKNNGGTVSIIGSPSLTSAFGEAALSTASISVSADNTNRSLKISVTGVAGTNILWNILLNYIESSSS